MIRDPWRTSPRGVVVTAAAIVWLLCAVAWPRDTITLTGLALSLLASGWALVAGIRMLLGERRANRRPADCAGCAGCGGPDCIQRPDASGQHPETARTDPDALGSDAADQDGHHPDDANTAVRGVQQWMALDLHRALGRGTNVLPSCRYQGFASWADWWADLIAQVRRGYTTAHALGTAAAAYCPHCGRGDVAPTADDWAREFQRAEEAETVLARVHEARDHIAHAKWGQVDAIWCLDQLDTALDGRLVHQPGEDQASDPQQVDDASPGSCEVVHLPGGPVRVTGDRPMNDADLTYLGEVLDAAKRRYTAEHPETEG